MDKCRHFEENKNNPIIFNNRHICIRNKMIFDEGLFKKGLFQIDDIADGIEMKPYSHFCSLGIDSKRLLKIHDMFKAIPNDWKMEEYMQVDIHNSGIRLKIGGQIGTLSDLKSRKVYKTMIYKYETDIINISMIRKKSRTYF